MQSSPIPADIAAVAEVLLRAKALTVSTGAGMSADSGVATFRGADGIWEKFNPSELATPHAFARDPQRVWEWYRERRKQLLTVAPHAGHLILAQWESLWPDFTLITQNVDGLHSRAGSTRVIELHGRLDVARCTACSHSIRGLNDLGEDPRCPTCAARVRPGVVWFGEPLPEGVIDRAAEAVDRCEVLLVIGTSGVVEPAASLVRIAREAGARVVELNPQPSEISALADFTLRHGSRDGLSALDQALSGLRGREIPR